MKDFAALLCDESAAQGKAGCAECSLIASGLQADHGVPKAVTSRDRLRVVKGMNSPAARISFYRIHAPPRAQTFFGRAVSGGSTSRKSRQIMPPLARPPKETAAGMASAGLLRERGRVDAISHSGKTRKEVASTHACSTTTTIILIPSLHSISHLFSPNASFRPLHIRHA
ncbi:hypothetical protein L1887_58042 [Cichorium endivia]|nr:hypothetical protein L1887_58042 [Cichorium endivia]